jgi:glycosyltransferase involved in cell wall biosynthesis
MKSVSWHGLNIRRLNFSGLNLQGIDLRDSLLDEINLSGANLEGARVNATRFIGAKLIGTNLRKANLEYADFASANLQDADCRGANLRNIRILHADFRGARLEGAEFARNAIDWRLAKNWRMASFEPSVQRELFTTYGPPNTGPRVLMLMWEFPRLVTGGGWTAAYHQLKNLRARGCDLTVMVPLPESLVDRFVFGNEINLIAVGREDETKGVARSGNYSTYSAYATPKTEAAANAYQYTAATPSLMERIDEFRLNAMRAADEMHMTCDVIHAHDWLMFSTAQVLSKQLKIPWVAHFHSLEADRQIKSPSENVMRIEAGACKGARGIVAVSQVTKNRLISDYAADGLNIRVIPNCLSESGIAEANLGDFHTKRVVFLGRLTAQKGPDLFAKIAARLESLDSTIHFSVFGQGEDQTVIERMGKRTVRSVPPSKSVPPASFSLDGLEMQFSTFERIAPVTLDLKTHSLEAVGLAISDSKEKRLLEQKIFKLGFEAFPIEMSLYSHVISVNVADEKSHKYYVVKTSDLKSITSSEVRFIRQEGHLSWERRSVAFDGASILVVPSRYEPFGMVVLEAMRHGVPVFYPLNSGVAEVMKSGIQFDPTNTDHAAEQILRLLNNSSEWQSVVQRQFEEISKYSERGYEREMQQIWELATQSPA